MVRENQAMLQRMRENEVALEAALDTVVQMRREAEQMNHKMILRLLNMQAAEQRVLEGMTARPKTTM